jgi:hypothetical protein
MGHAQKIEETYSFGGCSWCCLCVCVWGGGVGGVAVSFGKCFLCVIFPLLGGPIGCECFCVTNDTHEHLELYSSVPNPT